MSRAHIDPPAGFGLNPAIVNAATGKDKRMNPVFIMNREFKLAIQGCVLHILPNPGW